MYELAWFYFSPRNLQVFYFGYVLLFLYEFKLHLFIWTTVTSPVSSEVVRYQPVISAVPGSSTAWNGNDSRCKWIPYTLICDSSSAVERFANCYRTLPPNGKSNVLVFMSGNKRKTQHWMFLLSLQIQVWISRSSFNVRSCLLIL